MPEWDVIAPYYDLLFEERRIDVPFWVSLAKRFGSPVLEFACGTGRLTFPIARSGIAVTGIDISGPMLQKAIYKRRYESKKTQQNTTFLLRDSNNFDIPNRTFSAIFSPWGFHPVTVDEQNSTMESVMRHIKPGGYFVIDEHHHTEIAGNSGSLVLRDYKKFPEKGFTLTRQSQSSYIPDSRLIKTVFFLDKLSKTGEMRRYTTERVERIYTLGDITRLLNKFDFSPVEVFGNYDFSAYRNDSPRIVVIAKYKLGKLFKQFQNAKWHLFRMKTELLK